MNKELSIKILNEVLDYLSINPKQLSDSIGKERAQWAYDILNPQKKVGISKAIAELIHNKYPMINRAYLLTGEGEMLNSVQQQQELSHDTGSQDSLPQTESAITALYVKLLSQYEQEREKLRTEIERLRAEVVALKSQLR